MFGCLGLNSGFAPQNRKNIGTPAAGDVVHLSKRWFQATTLRISYDLTTQDKDLTDTTHTHTWEWILSFIAGLSPLNLYFHGIQWFNATNNGFSMIFQQQLDVSWNRATPNSQIIYFNIYIYVITGFSMNFYPSVVGYPPWLRKPPIAPGAHRVTIRTVFKTSALLFTLSLARSRNECTILELGGFLQLYGLLSLGKWLKSWGNIIL